jgi:hypothetical protein
VSGNTAQHDGGIRGLFESFGSVVSANMAQAGELNCWGLSNSLGYNIETSGDTCGFDQATDQGFVSAEDLKLGPLQDNGGPTMTHALLPGSVAIDVIPDAMCEVDTDQRGEPRPETGGTMCDVGAFELEQDAE